MNIADIIIKKRDGFALSDEEIAYFVSGSVSGKIADYQITAMLMALWFRGMDKRETAVLTDRMARSGDMADLSPIPGIKADKHSTGGVGDKTTLVAAPIAAACGVSIAKMSGRGLGFTGGTLDKLESIPGMSVHLSESRFFEVVRETGLSVIGQTGELARADKIFYALRDVTGTVDSIPLIASSIMSKKLASGADTIVLDVKCGSGAFMKSFERALLLAQTMVDIGEANGRRTSALITDMDKPLGRAVGNSLEVTEAAQTLKMQGPADLTELSLEISAEMLRISGLGNFDECLGLARNALESGRAFEKLRAMVLAQGGDPAALDDPALFPQPLYSLDVPAPHSGFVARMEASEIGGVAAMLGAGRQVKSDPVDPSAGILLYKTVGEAVSSGEPMARLFTSKPGVRQEAAKRFLAAVQLDDSAPAPGKLILARVDKNGVERL